MSNRRIGERAVVALFLASLAASGAVFAADCGVCQSKRDQMKAQAETQERTRELLGKNNAYLAVLSADQASKFLKVKSNLTVILKQLDQQKKAAAELEKDFQSSGCLACVSPTNQTAKNSLESPS